MRYFKSIYLAVALTASAGVYYAAPLARPYLPEGVLALVPAQAAVPGVTTLEGGGAQGDAPASGRPTAPAAPLRRRVAARQSRQTPPEPRVIVKYHEAPAEGAQQDEEEMPPILHGIMLAKKGDLCGWGITRQESATFALDGTRMGVVAAGELLHFRKTHTSSKGGMLECTLPDSSKPETPLLVTLADAYVFTGDYHDLSAGQLTALKEYYGKSGEIAHRKRELLKIAADLNPHFKEYEAKYKQLDAYSKKAKEITRERDAAAGLARMKLEEQLRTMKMGEVKLRQEYDVIHHKFREWKQQHEAQLPQAEKDSLILSLLEEQKLLAQRIPGLAY